MLKPTSSSNFSWKYDTILRKIKYFWINTPFKSSRSQMFFKMGDLTNFAILANNHLCWSLFLIKLQTACNFIKKRLQQVFFYQYCEVFKIRFFTELQRLPASPSWMPALEEAKKTKINVTCFNWILVKWNRLLLAFFKFRSFQFKNLFRVFFCWLSQKPTNSKSSISSPFYN